MSLTRGDRIRVIDRDDCRFGQVGRVLRVTDQTVYARLDGDPMVMLFDPAAVEQVIEPTTITPNQRMIEAAMNAADRHPIPRATHSIFGRGSRTRRYE